MKKLSVDTCVVLRLVSENNKFKERGYKKYEAYLYERKLEKDFLEEKIKGAMIKSFTPSKNSPIDKRVISLHLMVTLLKNQLRKNIKEARILLMR